MTNLGPYRTPGRNLEVVLDKSEKECLIKKVIARDGFDVGDLLEILGDSGYECNDHNIFLRYNKTAPIFPDKSRLLEDRFVALMGKDNSISLLVSGPYNGDISDLSRNLSAIKDIDFAYEGKLSRVVKRGVSKPSRYVYKGIIGAALSISLISGSTLVEGGMLLGSLFTIAAGAYYVKNKFKPISKETIDAANSFSGNARDYIFNNHALMMLKIEASRIQENRKRHDVFMALDGKISPEIFFRELAGIKEYWAKNNGLFDDNTILLFFNELLAFDSSRIVMQAFEKTHKLSKENYFSDLIKAINALFG